MNMISTGAFLPEMDASNKQETMAEKFARVWEKKNSKVAKAGGVSLMALSLAACGSSSTTTAVTPVAPTPEPDPEPEAPAAPTVNNYTLETTADVVYGKVGENDIIAATDTTFNNGDAIVDSDATDADVLTITSAGDIGGTGIVAGIETVNFNLDAFTAVGTTTDAIFEAAADNMGTAVFNVDNVKVGSSIASATVTALNTGSTVNFSDSFTTVIAEGDDNAELVVNSAATSTTVDGTGGGLLTKATVTSSAATAATIASDTDGTLDATTTAADMVITAAAATTVEATSAGSIDANTTDLDAATSVNLIAVDEIDVGLEAATTATFSAGGTTASTIDDAAGDTLTSVSLSGNATAHTFDLKDAEGVASVTITGSQDVTVEMSGADIDLLSDNAVTLVDSSTGTSTLDITTAAGDMDLSAAAADVIDLGIDNNTKSMTVASGAAVTISVDQTATTIDGVDAGASSNSVSITLDDGATTGGAVDILTSLTLTDFATATINVSADANTTTDDSSITGLTASADNTNVTINAGAIGVTMAGTHSVGTGALVINSDAAVALGTSDITAASITTTGTGAVTWTDANATEVVSVTTGGGADEITWADTTEGFSVSTGAGIDTVTLGGAGTVADKVYVIDLGEGATDKLVLSANDFGNSDSFTLTGVEIIEFANTVTAATMAGATLDGKGYILTHATIGDTLTLTTEMGTANALNLSNLVVDGAGLTDADNITVDGSAKTDSITVSGADGISNVLSGGTKADNLTGGTGGDVLDGNAGDDIIIGGDGNDNITGGTGADTMTGGDGNDTYDFDVAGEVGSGESIVEAASGGTDTVNVDATVDFTNMLASSFDEIEEIDLAVVTATFTGDQLTGETIELVSPGNGDAQAIVVNVAFGGTADLSSITVDASWTVAEDSVTINGLGGAETITGTATNDTINLGAGADTLKVAFGGAGFDTINGFTAGASGDVLDFTGTSDVVGTTNLDTDGFVILDGTASAAIVDGLTVLDNGAAGVADLASMDAAGLFGVLTDLDLGGGGAFTLDFDNDDDVFYIAASDGTNTGIFQIDDAATGSDVIAAADITLVMLLNGIDDAGTLTADNFADFA